MRIDEILNAYFPCEWEGLHDGSFDGFFSDEARRCVLLFARDVCEKRYLVFAEDVISVSGSICEPSASIAEVEIVEQGREFKLIANLNSYSTFELTCGKTPVSFVAN